MSAWSAFLRGLAKGEAIRQRQRVSEVKGQLKTAGRARRILEAERLRRQRKREHVSPQDELRIRLANLEGEMPGIIAKVNRAGYMEDVMDARFEREGGNWAPLKPSTVKRRGSAHPILQATGRLRRGAKTAVAGTFQGVIPPKWRGRQRFTGVPYAKYHQNGTPNMVARTFLRNPGKKEMRPAIEYMNRLISSYLKRGTY